ncbi:YhgE/Pip domain-containing protein [Lacticaseibacillus thailandensis]|uniref:YhgE/Pip domain-containing protein n=1 Tax=Lacticaseibacillus thailandensis TaxID=381741 RepID=UPI0006D05D2D|nr:YhgE/Pip domain-containing protein [Lacticaseibacillus thailandensis]
MIKEELRHIMQHKWVIWLMVATILIPIFYAYCFLTSAWDPYGHTSKLPIAVVNLDQPTTLKGKRVSVGAQTVAKLRKDDQLGWHITSSKEAAKGLKDNKYYAVITFPKDFSRDAATVLNKTPKQMHFAYKTNGSLNYIGEVMSQVGSDKLNDQIKAKVTQTYAKTFIQQIGSIGKQLKTAANGSKQITDGIGTLQSGTSAMPSGVSKLASGSKQLTSGIITYTNGVTQVNNGMSQLYAKVPTLSSGVQALYTGSGSLYKGLGQLYARYQRWPVALPS